MNHLMYRFGKFNMESCVPVVYLAWLVRLCNVAALWLANLNERPENPPMTFKTFRSTSFLGTVKLVWFKLYSNIVHWGLRSEKEVRIGDESVCVSVRQEMTNVLSYKVSLGWSELGSGGMKECRGDFEFFGTGQGRFNFGWKERAFSCRKGGRL